MSMFIYFVKWKLPKICVHVFFVVVIFRSWIGAKISHILSHIYAHYRRIYFVLYTFCTSPSLSHSWCVRLHALCKYHTHMISQHSTTTEEIKNHFPYNLANAHHTHTRIHLGQYLERCV